MCQGVTNWITMEAKFCLHINLTHKLASPTSKTKNTNTPFLHNNKNAFSIKKGAGKCMQKVNQRLNGLQTDLTDSQFYFFFYISQAGELSLSSKRGQSCASLLLITMRLITTS